MSHSYYYISLFVTFVYISVSFDYFLQRVASVNDCFNMPSFD